MHRHEHFDDMLVALRNRITILQPSDIDVKQSGG